MRGLQVRLVGLIGLALFVGAIGLAGCGDEPQTTEPTMAPLELDDALVPEVLFEGESATISAWGRESTTPFDRLEAEVLSWPGEVPGQIVIRAVGLPGPPPVDSDFQSEVVLPPLRVGDYEVRLEGQREIRALSVLPARGWIRYRSFDDPVRPDATLSIEADGTAIAHRADHGPAVRTRLGERELAEIVGWFRAAEFTTLDERYLSDHPMRVRRVDIGVRTDDGAYRVSAQEDLMPERLAGLVGRLDRLVESILWTETDRAPVVARLEIDPVEGDPGTARALRLSLVNVSEREVTLRFRTAQLYDFLVIQPAGSPNDGDVDENGDPGPDGSQGPERLLWNWAHDRDFAQVETEITLTPGESRTFAERWPGLDNRGNPVPPGVYHVRATIPSDTRIQPAVARVLVRGEIPEFFPLVGTLSLTPATAAPGTERTIQLAITNLNETEIAARFVSTQRFDFVLVDRRGHGPMEDHDPEDGPDGDHDPGHDPDDDHGPDGDHVPGDDHGPGHDPGDDPDPDDDGGFPNDDPGPRGIVWQWSADQVFEPAEGVVTWAAGATLVFDAIWPGTDFDGDTVPAGVYELSGWTTGRPGAVVRPVTVVVSP